MPDFFTDHHPYTVPQPARQDPSYSFLSSTNHFPGTTLGQSWANQANRDPEPGHWVHQGNWSRGPSSLTPGQRIASSGPFPNSISTLALQERLLLNSGADGELNAREGARALNISTSTMERIIEHNVGPDGESIPVADLMEVFTEFANGAPLSLISNRGIDAAIMELLGGRDNFFAWAGSSGEMSKSDFWNFVVALDTTEEVRIGRALSDKIFLYVGGSDGRMDPNEFSALIAEVTEDGTFDWDTARENVIELAKQLGPIPGPSDPIGDGYHYPYRASVNNWYII